MIVTVACLCIDDGIEKSEVSVVSRESIAIAGQFVTCVTRAVKRSEKPGLALDKGSESGSRNKFVSNELDVVDLSYLIFVDQKRDLAIGGVVAFHDRHFGSWKTFTFVQALDSSLSETDSVEIQWIALFDFGFLG